MVFAKFKKDELVILKSLLGKSFLSYERAKENFFDSTYGNIRLNFEDVSVDLSNEQQYFPEIDEEMTCFSCMARNKGEKYIPAIVSETEIVEIHETITKIEVITDTIEINQGETVIEADCALVLHTNKSTYTFARTEWFSEVIFILHNKDYNDLFSTRKAEESWSNDGESKVTVKRKVTVVA